MQRAEVHVQLKPGIFGVRVRIMPPDAKFPDKIQIAEAPPPEEKTTEAKTEQEPVTEEKNTAEASGEEKREEGEAAG
jgi:small subunit ribosomal protein S3